MRILSCFYLTVASIAQTGMGIVSSKILALFTLAFWTSNVSMSVFSLPLNVGSLILKANIAFPRFGIIDACLSPDSAATNALGRTFALVFWFNEYMLNICYDICIICLNWSSLSIFRWWVHLYLIQIDVSG